MKRDLIIVISAFVMLLALACGGGSESYYVEEEVAAGQGTTSEASAGAGVPTPAVAADAATVNGKVMFEGAPPENPVVQMAADPTCTAHYSGEPVKAQDVVVSGAGELANVFVYVKNYSGPVPPPSGSVLLDQVGCRYEPHVVGVQVGQELVIRNSDETLHNVHALASVNKEFNIGQPVRGMESKKTFDRQEIMIKVKCDVHAWMNSYVGVVGHPYFAVSDGSGTFSIGGLPPGTYTLEAWHEKLGTRTQQITVSPSEAKDVSFSFGT